MNDPRPDRSAAEIVDTAVRVAAAGRVATLGPRLVALAVKACEGVPLPATTSTPDQEPLVERVAARKPLTPLADPESGQPDKLGSWGLQPSTVGDLMSARGSDGTRIVGELERQCALESARLAPRLADDLAREHAGLARRLADEHAPSLTGAEGPLDPAAFLCSEVAALLVVAMLTAVAEQMTPVPLPVPPSTL
jgi:hypothetical protein